MAELTSTQLGLLKVLRFRETPPGAACWLAPPLTRRGTLALIVPTMMGTYEVSSCHHQRTWQELAHGGFVQFTPVQSLPPFLRHLARRGFTTAQSVTLTERGRVATEPRVNPRTGNVRASYPRGEG
jgi:hypothetical protein